MWYVITQDKLDENEWMNRQGPWPGNDWMWCVSMLLKYALKTRKVFVWSLYWACNSSSQCSNARRWVGSLGLWINIPGYLKNTNQAPTQYYKLDVTEMLHSSRLTSMVHVKAKRMAKSPTMQTRSPERKLPMVAWPHLLISRLQVDTDNSWYLPETVGCEQTRDCAIFFIIWNLTVFEIFFNCRTK